MPLTVLVTAYGWYALAVTVAVMIGVVAAILVFERRRARDIEHDLGPRPERRRER